MGASPTRRPLQPEAIRAVIRHARQHCLTCCDAQPVAAEGPACVKTKSDLVVMPSEGRICAFFCSERDHKPQNSGCGYTAQSFHTAWTQTGHSRRRNCKRQTHNSLSRAPTYSITSSARPSNVIGTVSPRVAVFMLRGAAHKVAMGCLLSGERGVSTSSLKTGASPLPSEPSSHCVGA